MINPLHLLYLSRKILQSSTERKIKRKILKTYISLSLIKQLKPIQKVKITDFQVDYCNFALLKLMFTEIFIRNEYLFKSASSKPIIIDGGSNIGMSVLYFNLIYPECSILAFEPDERTFLVLQENMRQNNLENVSLQMKALSNHDGTVDFYFDHENPGRLTMSTIKERMPKENKEVLSTRLSNYIEREVDFLKLDVEGSETEVIEDLHRENKIRLINQMAIEYHHHIEKGEDNLSKLLTILEESDFGYQVDCSFSRPWKPNKFQDILIYAYRK